MHGKRKQKGEELKELFSPSSRSKGAKSEEIIKSIVLDSKVFLGILRYLDTFQGFCLNLGKIPRILATLFLTMKIMIYYKKEYSAKLD